MKKILFLFLLIISFYGNSQTLGASLDKKTLALGEVGTYKVNVFDLNGKSVVSAPKNELLPFHFEELSDSISLKPELYERIIRDYEKQKAEIPAHRLVEIRYEDFVKSPVEQLQLIYSSLQLNGFEEALPDFMTYLDSQKKFEKNKHKMDKVHLEKIMSRWGFAMQQYCYTASVPDEPNIGATEQPSA